MEIYNPKSIHAFNTFEEEGHSNQEYNHFRLIDLTREHLYAMRVPAILDDDESSVKWTDPAHFLKVSRKTFFVIFMYPFLHIFDT